MEMSTKLPGLQTTWPSRPSSPPTPPARPSSTSKPPAPPSPRSPTPDRHLAHGHRHITTKAPQPPRLRGLFASPHRHRERLLRRHLQRRATRADRRILPPGPLRPPAHTARPALTRRRRRGLRHRSRLPARLQHSCHLLLDRHRQARRPPRRRQPPPYPLEQADPGRMPRPDRAIRAPQPRSPQDEAPPAALRPEMSVPAGILVSSARHPGVISARPAQRRSQNTKVRPARDCRRGSMNRPSRSPPDAVTGAFSSSLTTTVFSQRSMRRFEASLRRATPKGRNLHHPSSIATDALSYMSTPSRSGHTTCGNWWAQLGSNSEPSLVSRMRTNAAPTCDNLPVN